MRRLLVVLSLVGCSSAGLPITTGDGGLADPEGTPCDSQAMVISNRLCVNNVMYLCPTTNVWTVTHVCDPYGCTSEPFVFCTPPPPVHNN
jgi:hypothetical protein